MAVSGAKLSPAAAALGAAAVIASVTRQQVVYTILVNVATLSATLLNIVFASVLDVADLTHTTQDQVVLGLSVRAIAYCATAPLFPRILRHVSRQRVFALAIATAALATLAIPFQTDVRSPASPLDVSGTDG